MSCTNRHISGHSRAVRTSKVLLCWPKHTWKSTLSCKYDDKVIPHCLLLLHQIISTWLLRSRFYPIIFQLTRIARFHEICLKPSGSTLQPPFRWKWTELSQLRQPIRCRICNVEARRSGGGHDEPTTAEGLDLEDLVGESSSLFNENNVAHWRRSCTNMLNCFTTSEFSGRFHYVQFIGPVWIRVKAHRSSCWWTY